MARYSNTWTCARNAYCNGCFWWRYFDDFYGCKKFKTFKLDDFDRLCHGRFFERWRPGMKE